MERAVERSVIVDLGVKKLSTHQSDITVFSYFCNCKSSEQMDGHQGFWGMMTLIPLQSNFNWTQMMSWIGRLLTPIHDHSSPII